MPTLIIATNRALDRARQETVTARASALVAELLGKDERWVMVSVRAGEAMRYGGSDAPCAYLEVKSLGLAPEAGEAIAAGLCRFVEEALEVPPARVYIEMVAPDPALFGWNGGTFA